MDKNLGSPIAYGRTAEIYTWDDGHILKLFYDWFGQEGTAICHGDFHPGNVLASPQGETVIDWIDATRGNALADVARASILALGAVATTQTSGVEKLFVRLFHTIYLRRYFVLSPGGREEYGRWLPIVAAARLSENIPELEQWLLAQAQKLVD